MDSGIAVNANRRGAITVSRRKRKILTAAEILAYPDVDVPWIVENMIPSGGRVMLYGQGSSYKTMFVFDLAIAISSGMDLLPGLQVKHPGRVLLVSTEATLTLNRRRLEYIVRARNASPPTLQLHYCQDRYTFSDKDDVDMFLNDLQEIEPSVVILDPLVNFVGGDENSVKETEPFRAVIDAVIAELGTTFIILHHEGVSGKGRPRGSSAWHGWLDSELQFVKKSFVPPNGTASVNIVEVIATKMRDGVEDHLLSLLPVYNQVLKTIVFYPYSQDLQHQLYQIQDKMAVCKLLKEQAPLTTTDVAQASGLPGARAKEALLMLREDGVAEQNGFVMRSSSSDGSRQRRVAAWQLVDRLSQVDGFLAIMRARQREIEEDVSRYVLDPVSCSIPQMRPFD